MSNSVDTSTVLELASDLIGTDPEVLKQALLAALVRGQPVVLAGANVSRAGTAALQLLLAFVREAQSRQLNVALRAPSTALCAALATVGLTRDEPFAALLAPAS